MKANKLHIIVRVSLLLIGIAFLFSSVTSFYQEKEVIAQAIENTKKDKGEKVVETEGIVAVLVSIVAPDFAKEAILVQTIEASFLKKIVAISKVNFVNVRFFETLFTHIIAPNAP